MAPNQKRAPQTSLLEVNKMKVIKERRPQIKNQETPKYVWHTMKEQVIDWLFHGPTHETTFQKSHLLTLEII